MLRGMKKRLTGEEAVCSVTMEEALSAGREAITIKAVTNVVNLYRYNDSTKSGLGQD